MNQVGRSYAFSSSFVVHNASVSAVRHQFDLSLPQALPTLIKAISIHMRDFQPRSLSSRVGGRAHTVTLRRYFPFFWDYSLSQSPLLFCQVGNQQPSAKFSFVTIDLITSVSVG